MYIYLHIYMHMHILDYTTPTHTLAHAWQPITIYIYTYTYICICIYIYTHICIYMNIFTHTFTTAERTFCCWCLCGWIRYADLHLTLVWTVYWMYPIFSYVFIHICIRVYVQHTRPPCRRFISHTHTHTRTSRHASWHCTNAMNESCHKERWGAGVEYHFQEI